MECEIIECRVLEPCTLPEMNRRIELESYYEPYRNGSTEQIIKG